MLRRLIDHIRDASPPTPAATSAATLHENVEVRVADVDDLRARHPDWEDYSRRERWLAALTPERAARLDIDGRERELAATPAPARVHRSSNTTCVGLHEYVSDNLNPDVATNLTASHLAVGNDDATAPATGNTALNNEVYRTSVTDHVDNGNDLLCSTFLDSTEANGNTLKEVGLFTASTGGTLLNHSLITDTVKDSTKTVTVDVTLQFRA